MGGEGSHGHRSIFVALVAVKTGWRDVRKQSLWGLTEKLQVMLKACTALCSEPAGAAVSSRLCHIGTQVCPEVRRGLRAAVGTPNR